MGSALVAFHLERYEASGAELIVWPESAYNRPLPRSASNVARAVTGGLPVPLVFGAITYDDGPGRRRLIAWSRASPRLDPERSVAGRSASVTSAPMSVAPASVASRRSD